MNPELQRFVTAELAHHRRQLRDVEPADVLAADGFVGETCSCGTFRLERPVLRGLMARGKHHSRMSETWRRRQMVLMVEAQWTDHLIETVLGAVADWIDKHDDVPWETAAWIRGAMESPQDRS